MKQFFCTYQNVIEAADKLSHAYLFAGHINEAVDTASGALKVLECNKVDGSELARAFLLCGTMLNHQGFIIRNRFEEATQYLNQSLSIAKQIDESSLQAKTFLQLGIAIDQRKLLLNEGDFESAMRYHEEAMQKFEEIADQAGIGRTHFNIGLIHQRLRNREDAESNFSKALEIAQECNDKLDMSYAYRHRGFFYTLDGDWETATHYAEESLRLREEIGCRYLISPAHHVLGLVRKDVGDREAALNHLQIALELAKSLDLKLFMLQPLFALSEWYEAVESKDLALEYAQQALVVAKELGYRHSIENANDKIRSLS